MVERHGQTKLAKLADTNPVYLSQVMTGQPDRYGNPRRLGPKVARKIEKALGLPHGWMDVTHPELLYDPHPDQVQPNHDVWQQGQAAKVRELGMGRLRARHTQDVKKIDREIQIPFLDSRASMGNGTPLTDYVNVVEMVTANLPELRTRVSFSAPHNLRLLTGYGDSMSPTFNDGDVLLIDMGVTDLTLDAVYVMERHDQLYVKRIQRRTTGALRMISDNPVYPPEDIDPNRDGFDVRARVLCVWNFRKL